MIVTLMIIIVNLLANGAYVCTLIVLLRAALISYYSMNAKSVLLFERIWAFTWKPLTRLQEERYFLFINCYRCVCAMEIKCRSAKSFPFMNFRFAWNSNVISVDKSRAFTYPSTWTEDWRSYRFSLSALLVYFIYFRAFTSWTSSSSSSVKCQQKKKRKESKAHSKSPFVFPAKTRKEQVESTSATDEYAVFKSISIASSKAFNRIYYCLIHKNKIRIVVVVWLLLLPALN